MKKTVLIPLACIAMFSNAAFADKGGYAGVKVGQASIDVDYVDNASLTGAVFGYRFENNLAIEIEALSGSAEIDSWGYSSDIDLETVAIYGAWRSGDDFFFKTKVGVLREEVSSGYVGSEEDTGLSYGLGLGYQGDSFIVELEYTLIEEDVSAATLGLIYKF
ncbi:outer membrane beta-barrel protein [Thalassotalea sp. PLHSN55]|uniref:outer membrane beta-barrel protein n=1 Tax=Thalassotalea sp. PLHSN55 TaxID=3435888 RepID=UPI003F83A688